jgi:hypothetical protein
MMGGKTTQGASSPENPALIVPDPLSIMIALPSRSLQRFSKIKSFFSFSKQQMNTIDYRTVTSVSVFPQRFRF